MSEKHILIMLHCEQHTGYAIGALERVFEQAALSSGYASDRILWSYPKVFSPENNIFELGYYERKDALKLEEIHRTFPIDTILAFDMPYPTPVVKRARKLGISRVISYWGGSMSGLNHGLKLFAKRLEWYLRKRSAPNLFIFESEAMRLTAVQGRGVPKKRTRVVPLGVDTNIYTPDAGSKYAHDQLGIPRDRKIIFYSGHMEERKGVRVLIEAMNTLRKLNAIEPFHLLICGNKGSQSVPYEALISDSVTRDHVTFAGYREDVPALMQSAFLGVIECGDDGLWFALNCFGPARA
jgi:glycosyltransferase involved in cell wall biosynthesis